jgi:general secretion pathway protein G
MLGDESVMLTVKDNTFTLRREDEADHQETVMVKVDSTKTPKTIDFIDKRDKLERVGIYEIEGDTLKLCFAPDNRPKQFKSPPDTRIMLMVCRRQSRHDGPAPRLGLRDRARAKVAANQIQIFGTALDLYRLDMADYPTTDEGLNALVAVPRDSDRNDRWQGPYMERLPDDPWGKPYRYAYPGTQNRESYDLWSSGPDGKTGTADDIGNWNHR